MPPGERWIEASNSESDGDGGTGGGNAWGKQRLIVQPGENRLDLTLDQGSRRQEIRGRVVAPDGAPVAGALVLASSSEQAYSADDGTFSLSVEDDYMYNVWAKKDGYAPGRAAVAGAPVDGIELRLGEAATVRGRILGLEPGERARDIWAVGPGGPVRQGQLDQEGGFVIDGLPPGDWTILARYGDREGIATVSLSPGQSETWTEVEMEEAAPEPRLAKPRGQGPR